MAIIRDLEDLMNDIKNEMISNVQSVFNEINLEKGDTLLIPFESDAYHLYRVPTIGGLGAHPVEFFQYIDGPFSVHGTGNSNAIVSKILIDVVVCETALNNIDVVALRYQRAIKTVFERHIATKYTDVSVQSAEIFQGADHNDVMYSIASTGFNLAVC